MHQDVTTENGRARQGVNRRDANGQGSIARPANGEDANTNSSASGSEIRWSAVRLLPGQLHVTAANTVLYTVLGSCVSVCARDPVAGVGGMNHFMLPEQSRANTDADDLGRYGSYAIDKLLSGLASLGAIPHRVEIKLVGGGGNLGLGVGEANADYAEEYFGQRGVNVVAADLRGGCSRVVRYAVKSGRLWVRRLEERADS